MKANRANPKMPVNGNKPQTNPKTKPKICLPQYKTSKNSSLSSQTELAVKARDKTEENEEEEEEETLIMQIQLTNYYNNYDKLIYRPQHAPTTDN